MFAYTPYVLVWQMRIQGIIRSFNEIAIWFRGEIDVIITGCVYMPVYASHVFCFATGKIYITSKLYNMLANTSKPKKAI